MHIRPSYSIVFFCGLLLSQIDIQAQDRRLYLNPGLKLGYRFGPDGGTIGGFEISLTRFAEERGMSYGVFISIEKYDRYGLFHLGLEFFPMPFIGFSAGPTIPFAKGRRSGFAVTAFGGFLLYPYFRRTFAGDEGFSELGSFLKIPFELERRRNGVVVE